MMGLHKSLSVMESGVQTEFGGHTTLLICFSGIYTAPGIPIFSFRGVTSNLRCDKVYLRDLHRAWYHYGIDEKITSLDMIEKYLTTLIKERGYTRVCLMGSSMGAYAAILIGHRICADQVMAFSPQTFIGKWKRLITWDRRWEEYISKIKNKDERYTDVVKYLTGSSFCDTRLDVYYCSDHRLDALHARRLKNIPGINLIPVEIGGHLVIKALKEQGQLHKILHDAISKSDCEF